MYTKENVHLGFCCGLRSDQAAAVRAAGQVTTTGRDMPKARALSVQGAGQAENMPNARTRVG
eukprot:2967248-Pyramimonas_sp.AAC.1